MLGRFHASKLSDLLLFGEKLGKQITANHLNPRSLEFREKAPGESQSTAAAQTTLEAAGGAQWLGCRHHPCPASTGATA